MTIPSTFQVEVVCIVRYICKQNNTNLFEFSVVFQIWYYGNSAIDERFLKTKLLLWSYVDDMLCK